MTQRYQSTKVRMTLAAGMLVGSLACWVAPALATGSPHIEWLPQSRFWLTGDSTLHPFSATSNAWHVAVSPVPKANAGQSLKAFLQAARTANVEVTVPVRSLKSGDGMLDGNLYKTLEAAQYPDIRFTASEISPRGETADAPGRLEIAGHTSDVVVHAACSLEGKQLRLKGEKKVSMRAFGVTPPTLMFGAIKVKDTIVVHYDLIGRIVP